LLDKGCSYSCHPVSAQGDQEIAACHASAFAFQVLAELNAGNDNNRSLATRSQTLPPLTNHPLTKEREQFPPQTVRPKAERDLLKTVKRLVYSRLDGQLHHHVRLNLTKETQPQQVRPWGREVKVAIARSSQLLSPDTTIGQVFDQCLGHLLILGEPGAGKTKSLLDLALELVERAEADPEQLIPVIVDLSDWQPTVYLSNSRRSQISQQNFSEEELVQSIAERGRTYRLMERYEKALQDFNLAIELNPRYDWAIAERGRTYRLMERYEKALQDFNLAIELNPRDDWATAHRGDTYRLMGRYEEAIQDFNHALELNPRYDLAIAHRGRTYMQVKRYEEALQDFNCALEHNPKDDWAIASRGFTYGLMERYEEAIQDFNHALELEPEYYGVVADRGFTYGLMERYEETLQDFNRALELNPRFDKLIAERGITYRWMERYKEALQDFNLALEINPKYEEAIASRGFTYILIERYERALQDFNRALELDPKYDWCLYIRGFTYLILHQVDSAKADLNNAIQIAQDKQSKKPDDCENTFTLALYHLVAGNLSTSQEFYQAALQQGTSQIDIRDAIQDLKDLLRVFPENVDAQEIKATLMDKL